MSYYVSFHEKPFLPVVTIYLGLVHASEALPANMILVIENYYFLEIKDMTFQLLLSLKKVYKK